LAIVPGNYLAYVFGDDRGDAGYGLADTTVFLYPTLSAPLTLDAVSP